MSKPTIRRAVPADRAAIVELCKSSMRATYGGFLDEEKMRPWIEGGETDNYVASMLGQMLVAVEDDAVIGVASIAKDTLDLIWVAIDRRGRGVGTALMSAAEKRIGEDGHPIARLEVFEPNTEATRFYEAHGWKKGKTSFDQMAGVNKLVMEKHLSRG